MALAYATDAGIGTKATFGAIVLQTDETLEPEFARIFNDPAVALYHTRIPMVPAITSETLGQMADDMPAAAAMLPEALDFDVIAYGCTSASSVIGSERVHDLVREAKPGVQVTDPLAATIAACRHLGAKRIGFLTPYAPDVSARMRSRFEEAGLEIAGFGSFEEPDDRVVAKISEQATLAAIETVASQAECDLVFASCTNLRVVGIVAEAEKRIGKPVISSNIALAWHMMHLAGIRPQLSDMGRLLAG